MSKRKAEINMYPSVEIKIEDNTYTIESNQGIVVRKNGALLADFADGNWEWVNPNVPVEQTDLDTLVSACGKFEELNKKIIRQARLAATDRLTKEEVLELAALTDEVNKELGIC